MTTFVRRLAGALTAAAGIAFSNASVVSGQHRPDQTGTIAPRLEMSIGLDDGPPEYLFGRIADIAVSPRGDIYVLDGMNCSVRQFNHLGTFVRAFGGRGEGPAEFVHPIGLSIDAQVIDVFDLGQFRRASFTLGGRHVDTSPLPSIGSLQFSRLIRLRLGWYLGLTTARFSYGRPENDAYATAVIFTQQPTRADTLIRYHSGGTVWHAKQGFPWGIADSDFGPAGAVAVLGDSLIATVDGYAGKVDWYAIERAGPRLIASKRLASTARDVTRGDLQVVERVFAATRRKLGQPVPRDIEFQGPPSWSIATAAVLADDGSTWIRSGNAKDSRGRWQVIAADHSLVRVVQLPPDFDLKVILGGRAYGKAVTNMDSPIVQVYALH